MRQRCCRTSPAPKTTSEREYGVHRSAGRLLKYGGKQGRNRQSCLGEAAILMALFASNEPESPKPEPKLRGRRAVHRSHGHVEGRSRTEEPSRLVLADNTNMFSMAEFNLPGTSKRSICTLSAEIPICGHDSRPQ